MAIGVGRSLAFVIALATVAEVSQAAGNDGCAGSDIRCEQRISQLEQTLAGYEAVALKHIPEAAHGCWKQDSDAFRQSIDDCKDSACKQSALLSRISSLHSLQPQAQRVALDLPSTPQLLTVLAADVSNEDSSAPSDSKPRFEARGSLIHASEHPEHMGIAVSANGKDHVFLFDLDIGSHSGQDELLGLLGSSPTTQIMVRGQRLEAPTGVANFDPSTCRWVYELAEVAQ